MCPASCRKNKRLASTDCRVDAFGRELAPARSTPCVNIAPDTPTPPAVQCPAGRLSSLGCFWSALELSHLRPRKERQTAGAALAKSRLRRGRPKNGWRFKLWGGRICLCSHGGPFSPSLSGRGRVRRTSHICLSLTMQSSFNNRHCHLEGFILGFLRGASYRHRHRLVTCGALRPICLRPAFPLGVSLSCCSFAFFYFLFV